MSEASRLAANGKQETPGPPAAFGQQSADWLCRPPLLSRVILAALSLTLGTATFACAGRSQVIIETQSGPVTVNVELATNKAKRSFGLMYRDKLGAKEGMLFVFPREVEHNFWMKNTKLSLDMIFIDSNRRVVGVVKGARPFSTESLTVGRPSKFVLEVISGFVARHGIKQGDAVQFRGFDVTRIRVEP